MGIEEFTDIRARLEIAVNQLSREFEGIYDRAHVRELVQESAEQLKGAAVASFVPILAHRFARERLRAQAQADGKLEKTVLEVLFVSVSGGGRARIAASLLERRVGGSMNVHTAGSGEAGTIDPNVKIAMEEIGVDLAEKFGKPVTREVLASADIVVTLARSVGPLGIPSHARHVDWRVGDPAGAELDEVRRIRDDIERRVALLAAELEGEPLAAGAASQSA